MQIGWPLDQKKYYETISHMWLIAPQLQILIPFNDQVVTLAAHTNWKQFGHRASPTCVRLAVTLQCKTYKTGWWLRRVPPSSLYVESTSSDHLQTRSRSNHVAISSFAITLRPSSASEARAAEIRCRDGPYR
jgi:hypothetical protein